jgi:hypothetical protein
MWTFLLRRLIISLLIPFLWRAWRNRRHEEPAPVPAVSLRP